MDSVLELHRSHTWITQMAPWKSSWIFVVADNYQIFRVSWWQHQREAAVLRRIYLNLTLALPFHFPDWKCLIMLPISTSVREEWLLWFPVGSVGGVQDVLDDVRESSLSLNHDSCFWYLAPSTQMFPSQNKTELSQELCSKRENETF